MIIAKHKPTERFFLVEEGLNQSVSKVALEYALGEDWAITLCNPMDVSNMICIAIKLNDKNKDENNDSDS